MKKTDPDFEILVQEMGKKNFRRLYNTLYTGSRYHAKTNKRASGKTYENSPEKLQAIKEKYKNGIPEGEIEKWFDI